MKKTALITGASSGIGKELARIHATNGENLILVARRESALQELKQELERRHNIQVMLIVKDLSKAEAPKEVYQEVLANSIEVDYLINNAGFGGVGKFHERDWEQDEEMINLNVKALTALTRYFLPQMIKRNSGKILNVASTAGFLPGPLMAVYFATKSFVVSFSQAIAEELSGTKVSVTALCPGPVATEFASTADVEDTNLFKRAATAQSVAKIGHKAMMKGKLIKINDLGLRFALNWIVPLSPRKLVMKISRKMVEKEN